MGAIVNNRCFSVVQDAQDFYFSALPHSVAAGANSSFDSSYVQSYTVGRASGSGWSRKTVEYSLNGSSVVGVQYVDMAVVPFPFCDPAEAFSDGVVIGWAFGFALVAIGAFKMMRRGAR